MNDERAMQIINNVAEEWLDLGETDFATKDELCAVIHWLREKDGEQIQNYIGVLSSISLLTAKAILNGPGDTLTQAERMSQFKEDSPNVHRQP